MTTINIDGNIVDSSNTDTTQENTMNNTALVTTETEKKEQPKLSFWDKCKIGWNSGRKLADATVTVGLGGAAGNKKAKVMLAGGEALQLVGAVGAIASGVPGWVTACLIGGNSSVLGGFIAGFQQGLANEKKKMQQLEEIKAQMTPEQRQQLEEQMKQAMAAAQTMAANKEAK